MVVPLRTSVVCDIAGEVCDVVPVTVVAVDPWEVEADPELVVDGAPEAAMPAFSSSDLCIGIWD